MVFSHLLLRVMTPDSTFSHTTILPFHSRPKNPQLLNVQCLVEHMGVERGNTVKGTSAFKN
jgi:hypothetical protein